MSHIRMAVVPVVALAGRSIMAPDFVGAVIRGQGPNSYDCASCGTTLLESVEYNQVQDMTVKCGKCGTHNEIPRTHHTH